MKNLYLFSFVLLLSSIFCVANARTYLIIDTFVQGGPGVLFAVPEHEDLPDYWWTPYSEQTGDQETIRPVFEDQYQFHNTVSALGGQRDLICGFENNSTAGTSAILSIVNQAGDVAFSQGYIGGAYFQWDGDDSQNSATPNTGVFLGGSNAVGVGTAQNTTAFSERNTDGFSVDFTSANRAIGLVIDTVADHEVFYYFDAIDFFGLDIHYEFIPAVQESINPVRRWILYSDPTWVTNTIGATADDFRWDRVVAFQVRIWTFKEQIGTAQSVAIDTAFGFLRNFGLIIPGIVENDCDCNGTGESPVANQLMNLYLGSTGTGPVIGTEFTDNTGFFQFSTLDNGSPLLPSTTYTVCVGDLTRGRCAGDNGCRTTTTNALLLGTTNIDPVNLRFSFTQQTGLVAPSDQTIFCGSCSTNFCLGNATATTCTGGTQSVPTHTDSTTGVCPQVITRTFTFQGLTAVQRITIDDETPPSIIVQASSASVQCPSQSTLTNWISTRGGAQATEECSSVTWSNNWNNQVPVCNSVTVTFTARDDCFNQAQTTATYTIDDTTPPSFSTQPTSSSAECNRNNSDFNSFNAWLASNGGAVSTDNCGSAPITNNYVTGNLQRGCDTSALVVFTATDLCGNIAVAQATFSISDNVGPVITTQAQSQTGDCSSGASSFQTWLDNRGGAVATDACATTVTWENNAGTGGSPGGCSDGRTVTFTAFDGCGQSSQTTATFTIADNSPPVISPQASNLSINCEAADAQQQIQAWVANNGGASATDACSGVVWSNNFNSQSTGSCSGVSVTFTACDTCATSPTDPIHCRQTTATYSTNDSTPPFFSPQPQNSGAECGPNAQAAFSAWLSTNAGAVAGDTCSSSAQVVVTNNWPAGTLPALGCNNPSSVTFTARDPCGQTTRATAVFTISDNTPPTFTNLATDSTIPCSSTSNSQYTTWINNRAGAVATDTCTTVTVTPLNAPATPNFSQCSGTTTVTFVARDNCNLQAQTTASFTITDNTPPTITTQAQDRTVQCTGTGSSTSSQLDSWIASRGGAVATDACSPVTWTNTSPVLSGTCDASTTVTFTASDACGQQASTVATFSQTDSAGPVITTPAQSLTVPCNSDTLNRYTQWISTQGGAVATDACQTAPVSWQALTGDGVSGCDFETVTFVASDACGLSTRTTATFTSQDNSSPTFNPPAQDLTVDCNGSGNSQDYQNWVNNHGNAIAVDACAFSFTWTSNAPANGPTSCGSQPVTFTVTDNCNNSARTTATFTIRDNTPPTFSVQPSDLIVECVGNGTGNQNALNTWVQSNGGASAFDTCSSTVTFTQNPGVQAGNSCRTVRPYTFRAVDSCSNQAFATASFIVVDSSSPVITTPPQDALYECDGNGNQSQINSWIANRGGAVANDQCQSTVTWSNNFPAQGPLPCTSLLVTFTVTDACGFSTSTSATLTVDDSTDPTFSNFPDDVVVPCDADISIEALGEPLAFDVCDGPLFVSVDESSFDEPPVGNCPGDHVITRTWTAIDSCGNFVTDDQIIRVQIVRSSGPCDPTGCECDDCCPPAAPSNCLSAPCNPTPCQSVPCTATACTCSTGSAARQVRDLVDSDMIEPLPQCKPVYIYVNDDDDSVDEQADGVVAQQRMVITNEPLHESAFRPKSSSSSLGMSLMLVIVLALLAFF